MLMSPPVPIRTPKLCTEERITRGDRGADCVHPLAYREAPACAKVALLAAGHCSCGHDGAGIGNPTSVD